MNKRQEAAQKTAHARLHGELLCHFANASSAEEALSNLYSDTDKAYIMTDFGKIAQGLLTRHLNSIRKDPSKLNAIQAVKEILSERVSPSLFKGATPPDRFSVVIPWMECIAVGKLGPYLPILQCSLAVFSQTEGWERLVSNCEHCGNFFVAKTKKGSRFCSDKCKNDFQNRRRQESGKHREYMKKKRKEGKYQ